MKNKKPNFAQRHQFYLSNTLSMGELYLCFTQKDQKKLLKKLELGVRDPYYPAAGAAMVMSYGGRSESGPLIQIVCLGEVETYSDLVEIVTHEAVHVWQNICEEAGVTLHDHEVEAYAISDIVTTLIATYWRLDGKPKNVS